MMALQILSDVAALKYNLAVSLLASKHGCQVVVPHNLRLMNVKPHMPCFTRPAAAAAVGCAVLVW
jgi:hypothetical protein